MIALRTPSLDECLLIGAWRSDPDVLPMLRTGAKTADEQQAFYREVICNFRAPHRYYALVYEGLFVGLGGLTYLDETSASTLSNQITLVLGPDYRRQGLGTASVDALLTEAWRLELSHIHGECYASGPVGFWARQIDRLRLAPGILNGADATGDDGSLRWRWDRP